MKVKEQNGVHSFNTNTYLSFEIKRLKEKTPFNFEWCFSSQKYRQRNT